MNDEARRIIGLLERESPKFQVRSGTPTVRVAEEVLAAGALRTEHFERWSYATSAATLRYIAENTMQAGTSIETGGGWSTCVFAALSRRHYCVNPDLTANELIRSFVERHHIRAAELIFLGEPSDVALPKFDAAISVDTALIDGNHSFPIPIIDWHYIDLHMHPGSVLLLDDLQVPLIRLLHDYLLTEQSYERIAGIGQLGVFRRTELPRTWGWKAQRTDRIAALHGVDSVLAGIRARLRRIVRGGGSRAP